MLRVVVAALVCIVLGAVSGQAQNPAPQNPGPQPEVRSNIAYGSDPAQHLDLCIPPAWAPPGRPAVVMIHGGYWTVGDKGAYAWQCKLAADEGIVAAAIDYRLATGDPHHYWPAQAVDAQLAVRWLRSHAAEFGIAPDHICALGDSAGGQIVLYLAAVGHTVPGDDAGELPGVSSRIACAVDNFGPTDLSSPTMWPPDQLLFGSDGKTRPTDAEQAASPFFLIKPAMPPVMIAHGRDDKSVKFEQSTQLVAALKRDHDPVKMTVFDGGHEFEGLTPQQTVGIVQSELDFIKHPRGQ
ncbi:MAG TPA: alpha/beta hydrolase [Stellaceae bacterium]|nr:alpha/beta hydrolase [Stellaceae bacterium]